MCMGRWCAFMYPMVSSTSYSSQDIRLQSLTWYKSPPPVHFKAMASSDIPAHNSPGWKVIVRDFLTLAARLYLLNSLIRTFIAFCSQSELRESTIPYYV